MVIKNATDPNGQGVIVPTKIKEMTNKTLSLKLDFLNPEYVSMSSQNEKDKVYFKFPDGLMLTDEEGNGLMLDKASKDSGDGSSLDVGISVQP